jgi:hypothetical protein
VQANEILFELSAPIVVQSGSQAPVGTVLRDQLTSSWEAPVESRAS